MAHTTNPLHCPNAACRAPLADYESILTYTRVSGVTVVGCAQCQTAISIWPSDLENVKRELDDIKRRLR